MMIKNAIATVFGGTGFIGRQVVRELAAKGVTVKVATRAPECAYFLRPCGAVGQIVPFACDYRDAGSIAAAVQGSDFVVNCVGVLFEKGKRQSFQTAHVDIPAFIASACKKATVKSFVHVSALACDRGSSKYAKSKLAGEKAVRNNFKNAVILRPSVVFGKDDDFFNMFAQMVQILPSFIPLPLIGGGKTRFQPVFVGDVADAVMAGLARSEMQGCIYELGGPDIVNFKDIYNIIFEHTGRRQALLSVPFFIAKIQGAVLSLLPKPLLTVDQVESLKTDNVVEGDVLSLESLGLQATSMSLILPDYLRPLRPGGGRFETFAKDM